MKTVLALLLIVVVASQLRAQTLPPPPPVLDSPAPSYLQNGKIAALWTNYQAARDTDAALRAEIARLNAELLAAHSSAPAPSPSPDLSTLNSQLSTLLKQTSDLGARLGMVELSVAAFKPIDPKAHDLLLMLSGDFYQGAPAWELWVDGTKITWGGIVAARPQQTFVRAGIQPGWSNAELRFVNDAYGGSPDLDRNLYLVAASIDGKPIDITTLDLIRSADATPVKLDATGFIGSNFTVRIPLTAPAASP